MSISGIIMTSILAPASWAIGVVEIPTTLLGSAQSKDVTQQMLDNDFRIIFSTLESFYDRLTRYPRQVFTEMANKEAISLIAIDEAHLIISWQSVLLED